MSKRRAAVLLPLLCAASACEYRPTDLTVGAASYAAIPAATSTSAVRENVIGPLDVISVGVFREPDLTFGELPVEADGSIAFPLIGRVGAAGKTPARLAADLKARLDRRYVLNPQISVGIVNSFGQRVTVEGLVNDPGVFPIKGGATLLEVLARAKSPTETAALNEVVIFRFQDGQRTGAVFDVRAIRAGAMPDPAVLGGDTIVVGFSEVRSTLRTFLQAVPAFAVFTQF